VELDQATQLYELDDPRRGNNLRQNVAQTSSHQSPIQMPG